MPLLVLTDLTEADNARLADHMNARVSCEIQGCRNHIARVPTQAQLEARGWAIERRGERIIIVCPRCRHDQRGQ